MKTMMISLRALLFFTLVTGFLYPALVTSLAQGLLPAKANGSLVRDENGAVVGSSLIAQGFESPRYFRPRPSAVSYNPLPSGGSNLGPTSKALAQQWEERRRAGLRGDMLATSASGLDPHISPESAELQVDRVARARGQDPEEIRQILAPMVEPRQFGIFGEPKVNVLLLNLALDRKAP